MPTQQNQKKGSSRKVGRNKSKCTRYASFHRRETNKIRRVLQSNGLEFAKKWATDHNVLSYLGKLTAKAV
jgi:hypothetical protein